MTTLDKYPLTPELSQEIAYLEASNAKFHDRLGWALESDRMANRASELVTMAAQEVARRSGGGCTNPNLAIQYLKELHFSGKLTEEDVSLADSLVKGEGAKQHDVEAVISIIAPVLKKIAERRALENALDIYSKGGDLARASESLSVASNLGVGVGTGGFTLGPDTLDRCFVEPVRDPLPTGVVEMDARLRGGLERGGFGVFVAGTGVGKSLWLTSQTAEASYRGLNTLYVTMELNDAVVGDRIVRNLCNLTDLSIQKELATARFNKIARGKVHITYQSPRQTTVRNINTLIMNLKQEAGWSPDLVCIDPIDELAGGGKNDSRHEQINFACAALRDLANEHDCYVWGSSQPQRGKNRGKRLGVDDLADSMGKVRKATLVIGAWRTEEDEENGQIRFAVAKRTQHEVGSAEIGPLPTDLDHARIVSVSRAEPWW